jgi:phosphonate transport system substrate-binding protein
MAAALLVACLAACDEGVRPNPDRAEPELDLPARGNVPSELRVGVTPHSGKDTAALYEPVFVYLERVLERPVRGVTADNWDGLAELVNSGKVEIGIFSPLSYVKARRTLRAVPIATATRRGSPTYVGYLVTQGSWPPPALEELEHKRIAYVDRSSTSGWLYPRALLRERGFDPDTFFAAPPVFAGDHKEAVRLVSTGEVDVAAIASPSDDTELDALQVVAKTRRIPLDCVVIRNDIQRDLGKRLQAALIDLVHAPEAAGLQQSWGMNGFVRPDGRYDEIARLYDQEASR